MLVEFIDSHRSKAEFCRKFNVSVISLNKYISGEHGCSSKFIKNIVQSGLEFEKAFNVEDDHEMRD